MCCQEKSLSMKCTVYGWVCCVFSLLHNTVWITFAFVLQILDFLLKNRVVLGTQTPFKGNANVYFRYSYQSLVSNAASVFCQIWLNSIAISIVLDLRDLIQKFFNVNEVYVGNVFFLINFLCGSHHCADKGVMNVKKQSSAAGINTVKPL